MRRPMTWLALVGSAFLLSLLLAWPGESGADSPPPQPRATLVAVGETLGHLEPCDCVSGMLGGFPRRLAVVERLRAEGRPLLFTDSGDLTPPSQVHPELLRVKTRAALELLARSGLHALAVGEQDLRLGSEPLRRLAQAANVPLVGTNLRSPDGSYPFPRSRELELGELGRVVFLATLDPELGDPSGELEVQDPSEAVREALQAGPPGYVVLLFHGSREAARRQLAPELPLNLIICGHERTTEARPLERHGPAWLAETLRDGRQLLLLELNGEDVQAREIPLDEHVPDHSWARQRVDAYYQEARDLPEAPRRPVPAGGSFVGAATCKSCHPKQWEVFRQTRHHQAQARVAQADPKRADLPECTACHVTGYGYESGFSLEDEAEHLAEVGCEACHGVGENHVSASPEQKQGYGVREGFPQSWQPLCVSCHDPSNSPEFEFDKALERIKHWEGR